MFQILSRLLLECKSGNETRGCWRDGPFDILFLATPAERKAEEGRGRYGKKAKWDAYAESDLLGFR